MRDSLNKIVGPDYSPIWADKNSEPAHSIQQDKTHRAPVSKLFGGEKENKCYRPCTTTEVKSVLKSSNGDGMDYIVQNLVSFKFQERYVST